jgi:hypothetical protein
MSHFVEGIDKILKFIQRYFTYKGKFNMIYQYHIRILLHFTGKDLMNIPFYLFRSMGKMVDRVQAKSKVVDASFFHSGMIRMLVMEELKKINISWEKFIAYANMQLNVAPTPQSKVQIPLPTNNVSHTETRKKRKGKYIAKDKEAPNEVEEEEGGAHHSPQSEISPQPTPELEEIPSAKTTIKKGRKLHFPSPTPAVETRARRPFTRSSSQKEIVEQEAITKAHVKKKHKGKGENVENPIEIIYITTPPDSPTFKRLIRQLKDARKEIFHLKGEGLAERKKMKDLMDMYKETIELAKFTTRRFLPLHRHLRNLYRRNRDLQSQNIKLKEELQPFKYDLAQRNISVLSQETSRISAILRR